MNILIYGYGENLGRTLLSKLESDGFVVYIYGNVSNRDIDREKILSRSDIREGRYPKIDAIIFSSSTNKRGSYLKGRREDIEESLTRMVLEFYDLKPIIESFVKEDKGSIIALSNQASSKSAVEYLPLGLGKNSMEYLLKSLRKEVKSLNIIIKILRINFSLDNLEKREFVSEIVIKNIKGLGNTDIIEEVS